MHTVIKGFPVGHRRFRPGDKISDSDCDSVDLFETLIALGYVHPTADQEPAKAPGDAPAA